MCLVIVVVYYSKACAIPDTVNGDNVVITGGVKTRDKVSVYNVQGWQEDLPPLNTGREQHACTSYVSGGKRVEKFISYESKVLDIHFKICKDAPCYRRI